MRILLSNDDGIHADGLRAMYTALCEAGHTVHVYAPATEQSAASSKLTLSTPLRITTVKDGDFVGKAVSGTPADCVQIALAVDDFLPDMVVSGINAGPNIGIDVFYSGTVAAALEGAMAGIPALALSRRMHGKDDPLAVARHAAGLLPLIPWDKTMGRVINVNYPIASPAESKGLRVCPISPTHWKPGYDRRLDPRGRPYYWFSVGDNRFALPESERNSDVALLDEGFITLTPLHFDVTDAPLVKALGEVSLTSTSKS